MKITGDSIQAPEVHSTASSKSRSSGAPVARPSDHIHLSNLAAALVQTFSTEHSAKVSAIEEAVSSAQYHPDASAVAESILRESLVPAF